MLTYFVACLCKTSESRLEDARAHAPNTVCIFLSHQANLAPTTHTPSHEACHPIMGRVLSLVMMIRKEHPCFNRNPETSLPKQRTKELGLLSRKEQIMMLFLIPAPNEKFFRIVHLYSAQETTLTLMNMLNTSNKIICTTQRLTQLYVVLEGGSKTKGETHKN